VKNTDRSIGVMLAGTIAKKYGDEGLPENTITTISMVLRDRLLVVFCLRE
jgi:hypothetical protein